MPMIRDIKDLPCAIKYFLTGRGESAGGERRGECTKVVCFKATLCFGSRLRFPKLITYACDDHFRLRPLMTVYVCARASV